MQVSTLAITGAPWVRYRHLHNALRDFILSVTVLETGALSRWEKLVTTALGIYPQRERWAERRIKNWFAFMRRSRRAEEEIAELRPRPDLILHMHCMFSPSWRRRSIPYALYLDYTMALAGEQYPIWAPFLFRAERQAWMRCETRTYRDAAHIFVMSDIVKRSVVDSYGIPETKVSVVGAAGDFRAPFSGVRKSPGKTILFVSAEFYRKGGSVLFSAFEKLHRASPELKLLIAGTKPPLALPEGAQYLGFFDSARMADVYLQAGVAVLPSFCDPFPLTLIEAMNFGVPCVATRVGGIEEIVGSAGLLIQPGDPQALANALETVLNDPARASAMSDAGRARVRESLNWDSVAQRMMTAISRLDAAGELHRAVGSQGADAERPPAPPMNATEPE